MLQGALFALELNGELAVPIIKFVGLGCELLVDLKQARHGSRGRWDLDLGACEDELVYYSAESLRESEQTGLRWRIGDL